MMRRTKIVATLGPASSDSEVLGRMLEAGVDVIRINFSHGTKDEHITSVELVRSLARSLGRTVGVLADLQGPKIRIGKFEQGKIRLRTGDEFILDAECQLGNQERVGLDYRELPNDVEAGATLLLDDGRIVLTVAKVRESEIFCEVVQGGILSNNKGINRKGGGLSAPALTAKDLLDIKTSAVLRADYLAVSFPRSGDDIRRARALMQEAQGHSLLMAKIERSEAILALDDILEANEAKEQTSAVTDETVEQKLTADDWRLLLVNKQHPVPENYTFTPGKITGNMKCDARIIDDLMAMMEAAKADGINLMVCSPYRDYNRQTVLFNRKIDYYMNKGYSYLEAYKISSITVTVPGASEHQIGLALDIVSDTYPYLEIEFGETQAGKWLNKHSCEYGFILRYPLGKEYITGIQYEPWHFRYVGKEAATAIMSQGITLEEFLEDL